MTSHMALAAAVRGIRQSRGLSQQAINSVDLSYLNRLERGKVSVSVEVLQRIARILDVEPAVLLLISSSLESGLSVQETAQKIEVQLADLELLGAMSLIEKITNKGELSALNGRPPLPSGVAEQIRELRETGLSISAVASRLGISKSTVHRYISKP